MASMFSKPKSPTTPTNLPTISTNLQPAAGVNLSPMPQIQAPNRQIVQTPLMSSISMDPYNRR